MAVKHQLEKETLLEQLHTRFGAVIERKCAGILGNNGDAQDAKQETFIVAYRKMDSFNIEEGVGYLPWLYAIANNVCLHMLRSRKRKQRETPLTDMENLEPVDPLHPERLVRNRHLLIALFDKLNNRTKQVFIAYYLDGMTQEQVADCCGITRRTVANRLENIRKHARPFIDSEPHHG